MVWFVRFFRDPIRMMRRAYAKFGPVSAIGDVIPVRSRPRLHVLAFGPEYNEQILGDPDRFRGTGQTLRGPADSAQRRIRAGLTRMTGEKHRQQRRLIVPTLQRKAVESYYPAMVSIVDEYLAEWQAGEIDLWRSMRGLSLRLSSRILFGVTDPKAAHRLARMIEEWGVRNFSRGVWLFPLDLPGTPYRALLAHASALEQEILRLAAEKRAEPGPPRDTLGMLVRAYDDETGDEMTDADLVGQTTILFAASYETMVNALTWTLFLIAQHPQVAHDMLDELDAELDGEAPAFDRLGDLPLLDAAIKESMRVLPPVPFTIRATMHGARIGHLDLSDGDRVVCSHFITHHMPEIYAEPERFRPERWFEIEPTQYEYLPFSAGPRLCVGYLFAMTAMKVVVTRILQKWRWTLIPNTRVDPAVRVTMAPRGPLHAILHPPDRRFEAVPLRGGLLELVDLPRG